MKAIKADFKEVKKGLKYLMGKPVSELLEIRQDKITESFQNSDELYILIKCQDVDRDESPEELTNLMESVESFILHGNANRKTGSSLWNVVAFQHKSLQEFFTARKIYQTFTACEELEELSLVQKTVGLVIQNNEKQANSEDKESSNRRRSMDHNEASKGEIDMREELKKGLSDLKKLFQLNNKERTQGELNLTSLSTDHLIDAEKITKQLKNPTNKELFYEGKNEEEMLLFVQALNDAIKKLQEFFFTTDMLRKGKAV